MTPEQRSAYNAYPAWIAQLSGLVDAVHALPLEELKAANTRITLVGGFVSDDGVEPADPIALARQMRLLDAAITFRDTTIPPKETEPP